VRLSPTTTQLRILSKLYGLALNLAGLNLVHPYGLILTGQEKGYAGVLLGRISGRQNGDWPSDRQVETTSRSLSQLHNTVYARMAR